MLHLLIHMIIDNCKFLLHAWYLDNGIIVGDSEEVAKAHIIILETGLGFGLELNICKIDITLPMCDGSKYPREFGLLILGGQCYG